MKTRMILASLFAALIISQVGPAASADKVKLAFVDLRRALNETTEGKKAMDKLTGLKNKLQKKIERMPWVHVEVTEDCTGCGICAEDVCFINAIQVVDGRAVIQADCRGCGNCAEVCPVSAIRVVIESPDYIDHAIQRLSEAVDVQ